MADCESNFFVALTVFISSAISWSGLCGNVWDHCLNLYLFKKINQFVHLICWNNNSPGMFTIFAAKSFYIFFLSVENNKRYIHGVLFWASHPCNAMGDKMVLKPLHVTGITTSGLYSVFVHRKRCYKRSQCMDDKRKIYNGWVWCKCRFNVRKWLNYVGSKRLRFTLEVTSIHWKI